MGANIGKAGAPLSGYPAYGASVIARSTGRALVWRAWPLSGTILEGVAYLDRGYEAMGKNCRRGRTSAESDTLLGQMRFDRRRFPSIRCLL